MFILRRFSQVSAAVEEELADDDIFEQALSDFSAESLAWMKKRTYPMTTWMPSWILWPMPMKSLLS